MPLKFCGKAQFPHSFGRRKPCLFTIFLHQESRWNYHILAVRDTDLFFIVRLRQGPQKCFTKVLTIAFTLYKVFLKNKKRSGAILLALFSTWVLKKNVSNVIYFIIWPNFNAWLPILPTWDVAQCKHCNCFSVCDVINFEITLSFFIKPFS